jgi:chitin synthase
MAFCDRYVPTMRDSDSELIRRRAQENSWNEDSDYSIGHTMIWLMCSAWKVMVDVIREAEREARKALRGQGLDDGESVLQFPGYSTEFTHHDIESMPSPITSGNPYSDSEDYSLQVLTIPALALP